MHGNLCTRRYKSDKRKIREREKEKCRRGNIKEEIEGEHQERYRRTTGKKKKENIWVEEQNRKKDRIGTTSREKNQMKN